MILPFSTQLNGKPTYFVEKIISCLALKRIITFQEANEALQPRILQVVNKDGSLKCFDFKFDNSQIHSQKLHTLRDDINDRWHRGIPIDYFINVRQKNMFRFAPKVPVVSTQEVFMTHKYGDVIEISIGDKYLMGYTERLEFAINDGFDNWEDFFNYFYPKIKAAPGELYKPKLIHWTDLRY